MSAQFPSHNPSHNPNRVPLDAAYSPEAVQFTPMTPNAPIEEINLGHVVKIATSILGRQGELKYSYNDANHLVFTDLNNMGYWVKAQEFTTAFRENTNALHLPVEQIPDPVSPIHRGKYCLLPLHENHTGKM